MRKQHSLKKRQTGLFILLTILFLSATKIQAQKTEIKVTVQNNKKEKVPSATILALLLIDTTQSIQKVTDSSGSALFALQQGQKYRFSLTSVGYEPLEETLIISNTNPIVFTLFPGSKTLNNVVITATRPIMRQEDDKTIVDPENLAASSTNAHEILEKTPGLFVDQDGNIYLNSSTPATIYINGREQRMSAADIATMLKSLPPNAIASIEILRTPSARYDASGSGGIVNVVLKKGVKLGLTGSVNTGFNQGRYGNRFLGINLNNSNGRFSSFINLQYSRRNNYMQVKTDRIFAPDSLLSQDALTRYPTNSFYLGFGLGYSNKKKWDLNYDGRITLNQFDNATVNESFIKQISTGNLVTSNLANVRNSGKTFSITQGVSAKFKIDSTGSEWTTDVSYNYAPTNSEQDFSTAFTTPHSFTIGGRGDIHTDLHYLSAQTNLSWKLPKKFTVETGLKSTNAWFTNATDYIKQTGTTTTKDLARTASYRYNENINSAYLQASKSISGVVVKAGTRLENTNMIGNQELPKDTSFALHRTDLFPYLYISRDLMKIMGYSLRAYLVYRRTISRPSYEYLNPFPRYVDQYLFETGNPTLRPQFTQNYEANISVDERPILAIGQNHTKDIFTNVIYQSDTSKSLAYRTYDNLGTNKETYFRALGAIPPGKRFFFVFGGQYNHNHYNGLYENKPLSFKRGSWTVFTYQTFKITPLMQFTLNGFARFNGQAQFYELSSFGALNASINRQFLKKKLLISASVNDIFFTNNNEFFLKQGTVHATGLRKEDTRRFGINIRYNFGFRKKEENNLFNLESPERAN